jgi:hypothetical protein
VFRDITTGLSMASPPSTLYALDLAARYRSHPSFANKLVRVFDGLDLQHEITYLAEVRVDANTPGADYFVLNSSFNNTSGVTLRNEDSQGALSGLDGDPDLLNVYWRNVSMKTAHGNSSAEILLYISYFDGVTDTDTGQGSEDAGTVSFTASGGETYIDVNPDLWMIPLNASYVGVSGTDASLVSSIASTCGDGTFSFANATSTNGSNCDLRFHFSSPLSAAQAVAFDWEAAIKPWPNGVAVPDTSTWQ